MATKVAINGFGRIGRLVARAILERTDHDLDLVAINEDECRIRFGSCKRNPLRLLASVEGLRTSAGRFLQAHPRFAGWTVEYVAIAPEVDPVLSANLQVAGVTVQSLRDLTADM